LVKIGQGLERETSEARRQIKERKSRASSETGTLWLFGKEGTTVPLEYERIVERSYPRWV
jgi:hypothetical protein